MQLFKCLYCCTLTVLYIILADAEVKGQLPRTSMVGMFQLVNLETKLIANVNEYANELRDKLEIVQRGLAELRAENEKGMHNPKQYLLNPLNGFKLIRHMQRDWTYWQLYMEQPVGEAQIDFFKHQRDLLPTKQDLDNAIEAIHRIQTTYDMPVESISGGVFNGRQYNVSLNGLDAYALGLYHLENANYGYACQWLNQSVRWFEKNQILPFLNLDLYQVKAFFMKALIRMDRLNEALSVVESILKVKRFDVKLLQAKVMIEKQLKSEPNLRPKPCVKAVVTDYERGCRGLFKMTSNLHCLYNTTNSHFLRLAPLKMELVSLDPYMVIYHDIISTNEMNNLKQMALPHLKRAGIVDVKPNQVINITTRAAQVAYFPDFYNNLTGRINQLVVDMTRFDTSGSDMIQLVNYDLGGHCLDHFDFYNMTDTGYMERIYGDRIATVMFALSDVELGGATVFPKMLKALQPKAGSAIMWYNLNNDGTVNPATSHAGCPVVVGSKWILTKFIRERKQLFRNPCF